MGIEMFASHYTGRLHYTTELPNELQAFIGVTEWDESRLTALNRAFRIAVQSLLPAGFSAQSWTRDDDRFSAYVSDRYGSVYHIETPRVQDGANKWFADMAICFVKGNSDLPPLLSHTITILDLPEDLLRMERHNLVS